MKNKNLIPFLCLAAVMAGSMIISSCDPFELDGPRTANDPPSIEWANLPQDSIPYSKNPTLKWVGKDTDGQLTALDYQYAVLLEEAVDSLGGPAAAAAAFPDTIEWTSVGNVTEAVVPLFASADPSDSVSQYVFMRCQDAAGDYSNIIYLFLSRNNHPPTCSIVVPAGPQWCLPDTSDYWHGISVSWEGKDSLDYTGIQPDFLWEIRKYGPFADSADADTLGPYYNLINSETGDWLLPLEEHTFTDLVTGWWLIYVRNFDDASVPAEPAIGIFQVFEPNWIRHPDETNDILIVNHSSFSTLLGNLSTAWRDSVSMFYSDLMTAADISSDKWDWSDVTIQPHSSLYNYRMVIVDDIDWNGPITDNPEQAYADYLAVGGKLWVNGRFSFANVANQGGRVDYGPTGGHPLAYTYIDLSAAMFPPTSFDQAEFVGANPVTGTGFPIIEVDTLKIQALAGTYDYALPRVEYLMRNANSETIYKFTAVNPDTSQFHGFPVAVRNETSVFKASYFSFPLFFIKHDQAMVVGANMIDWFLNQ